jgi:hypothetical protein
MSIKTTIKGLQFRRTDGVVATGDQARILSQRLSNSAILRVREGESSDDYQRILAQRQLTNVVVDEIKEGLLIPAAKITAEIEIPQIGNIALPERIDFSDRDRIFADELRVGFVRQIMRGYQVEGPAADELNNKLRVSADPNESFSPVSLWAAREVTRRLNELVGYMRFRLPFNNEWEEAIKKVGNKLSGNNWNWTETMTRGRVYILRHLFDGAPLYLREEDRGEEPANCCNSSAIRLLENKKPFLEYLGNLSNRP